jgi:nucleolar protein 4
VGIPWRRSFQNSLKWVSPPNNPTNHGFRVHAREAKAQRQRRRSGWYAYGFFARGVTFLISKDSRSSTLFVSNLPYTVTSTDLKTLFSDIAPVRNAFVVLEHGTGVSKGVGYVSFAIKEDVRLALEKISSEGLTIDGRSVRVQLANTRHKDKDGASASGKNVDQEAKPTKSGKTKNSRGVLSPPKDPLAIRTIVLSGLPPSIDAKVLWKKVRKQEGAEKVDWPVKLQTGEEDPAQGNPLLPRLNGPGCLTSGTTLAYALFSDPKTAQDAVKKLHAHIFKGSIISATLKKRVDNFQAPVASTSTHASSSSSPTKYQFAPSRANRLIIRNLPFDIRKKISKRRSSLMVPFTRSTFPKPRTAGQKASLLSGWCQRATLNGPWRSVMV